MLFKNWKWLFENTNQTPPKPQKLRNTLPKKKKKFWNAGRGDADANPNTY